MSVGDTAWMLVASALVLLMTPGLAFFYGGLVRRKNVLSVLMQCFMCMGLVTVLWAIVGFSLAFGEDTAGGFIGSPSTYLFLHGLSFTQAWPNLAISGYLFMIFQCMFAVITPALIIGAFAERMKFSGFCVFTTLWVLLVYCPVAHWVWGGASGFFALGGDGALDFAGGTVIHVNAGIAALVACILLGKRQGYPEGISPPHSLPFAVLGAGLLWFGWFGFNAGSAGAASDQAVRAFVVTHLATAAAALTWSVIEWAMPSSGGHGGKPTVLGIITGAVAGLVAITPASGYVDPMGAMCIGIGASVLSYIFVAKVKPRLGYDDSLDVFGVHGISGIWGAIATGIWAVAGYGVDSKGGLLAGNSVQILVQFKAVAYTLVYSIVVSAVLLKVVDAIVGLRAENHEERVGLDLTEHAEVAYTVLD
ncbi:MAG: ammonium transporter [Planctomycetes bacterium]|nr:ammonium transporter [Planctomycetota bacterium]